MGMSSSSRALKRVAVTGMGSICGLGHGLSEVWSNILEGRPGVTVIENAPIDKLLTHFAGEVKNFQLDTEILSEREAPRFDRFIHYCLHSGFEAFKDAGLWGQKIYDPSRVGSICGVGMGGFPHVEAQHTNFMQKGLRRLSPFFIPSIIPNMSSGLLSIKLGLKGVNYSTSSACASAGHALTSACYEIMLGRQDVVVSGGSEGVLCPLAIGGFQVMKALSKKNDEPEKASRPFDKDRDGFVMGEGAGILVLEDLEKAEHRGAKIYAEIVGFGSSSDAEHITQPNSEGIGASTCMDSALEFAGLDASQIDYINAHGTSTPLGDIAETKAIKRTFKNHCDKLYVSSTKSMTGHLLGAAGGLESIFCIKALEEGVIPPTINLDNPDPECDLNYVPHKAVKADIEYALNNSFGFGGTNSSLIFKKYNS